MICKPSPRILLVHCIEDARRGRTSQSEFRKKVQLSGADGRSFWSSEGGGLLAPFYPTLIMHRLMSVEVI